MKKLLLCTLFLLPLSNTTWAEQKNILDGAFAHYFPLSENELKLAEQGDVESQYKAYMHFFSQPTSPDNEAKASKWKKLALNGGHHELLATIYNKGQAKEFLSNKGYPTDNASKGVIEYYLAKGLLKENKNLLQAEKLLQNARKNNIKGAEEALKAIDPRQLGIANYQMAMIKAQFYQADDKSFHKEVVNRLQAASKLGIVEADLALIQANSNPKYEFASQTNVFFAINAAATKGHIESQLRLGQDYLLKGNVPMANDWLNKGIDGAIENGHKEMLKTRWLPQFMQTLVGPNLNAEQRRKRDQIERAAFELKREIQAKLK